ncbi:MAG: response regulator, partial [Chromatiales bacterium]|nr:response regulator [Chromatiales bacterium]
HFTTTDAFYQACQRLLPSVIIMDMVFAESSTTGADVINQVCAQINDCPATIFISQYNDMEARLAALRAGARRYLHKPVDPEHLLACTDHLTGRRDPHPYRILIIDDDDTLAQYHSEILESHGIETRIITNPMMALEVIAEYKPELLLLDIYMDGCSGTELTAVIRQDDNLAHMPIVFLSEELDIDYQMAALNLGGDDFITKPVNPDYLAEIVRARLSRSRNIHQLSLQLQRTMRELKYQQVALNEHSIVSIAEPDGTISYVNDKFCEISQYGREELIGQNHRILKSQCHPDAFYQEMWETISSGKVWRSVLQNRAKDGSDYWVDSTIVPFLDTQGMPYKYVGVRTDVTPLIKIQRDIEIARDEAEEASLAKSQFLSSMSHELRTPMNAILGFSQLLGMDSLEGEKALWVSEIIKGGNHLLSLINDTLDLARIESGQIELSIEPIILNEVIDEVTTLLRPLFESRNIQWSATACTECVVKADRTRLKQVIINLLSNASKYNHEGGTIQIRCSNGSQSDFLRIAIIDSGPGVPQQRLHELFEPFNRLDHEGGTIEGSGIGLTICKDLVSLMGGEIGVESELGTGSTFWLELPITSLPRINVNGEDVTPSDDSHDALSLFNVLYIEDNPVNLRLVNMVLSKQPHIRVQTAHEPFLGLEMAREAVPDLILLDINLPGIDGYEVLERLRADPTTAHIPVIAVTAKALTTDIERGKTCGFDSYVTKPINLKRFTETVNQMLLKQS